MHTLTLLGRLGGELRLPVDALQEVLAALLEAARQATTFVADGESSRRGSHPAWLNAACAIYLAGLRSSSAGIALMFEAPSLAEAVPERFSPSNQGSLFADTQSLVHASSSAIDVLGSVLDRILRGDPDSVFVDRGLLATCARLARRVPNSVTSIRFDGIAGLDEPVALQYDDAAKVELLRDKIPEPRAVRVTGMLDTVSPSKFEAVLTVSDGSAVKARLSKRDEPLLKDLVEARVVVSGIARFHPSGALLQIDVEHLGPAREGDVVFDAVPHADLRLLDAPLQQDESSGVSSFFGTWPGDETEEELLRALRAVR